MAGPRSLPPVLATLLRFGTVGVVVAAIYALGFALLAGAGLASAPASTIAYLAAIVVQFLGHRHFTFRSGGALGRTAGRFLAVNGLGLGLSTALVLVLRDLIGLDALTTGLAVSLALAAMNWVILQHWVFRR
ncbi:hypothetical protein GCM10008966_32740 [Rhodovulum strictum]